MNGKGKKKTAKKTGKPSRKRQQRKTKLTRTWVGTGAPPSISGRIKWSGEETGSTGGLGAPSVHIMMANSLYDPDYLNNMTNDQPTYFDILNQQYSKYYVKAVSGTIRIKANNVKCTVFATNELLTLPHTLVWDEYSNYRFAQTKLLSDQHDMCLFHFKFTTDQVSGIKGSRRDDDYTAYLQPTQSNPLNPWWIYVFIQPIYGDDQPFYYQINTYQDYDMWELVKQPRS